MNIHKAVSNTMQPIREVHGTAGEFLGPDAIYFEEEENGDTRRKR